MITNELVGFIKAQRAAGKDDNFIRETLLAGGGWNNSDVDEALAIAGPSAAAVPKPPQPPAPPQDMVPRMQVMPSAPPAPSASMSLPTQAPAARPAPIAQAPAASASVENHQWSPMGGGFTPRPNVSQQPIAAPSFSQAPVQTSAANNQSQGMAGQFMPRQEQASFPQGDQPSSFTPKASAPVSRSSHRGIYAFAVIVLLIACGAGFAYLGGYLSFGVVSDPAITDLQAAPENVFFQTQEADVVATTTDASFEDIESVQVDDLGIEDLDSLTQ